MDMTTSPDLQIRRFFNAPREAVWSAWTRSDLLQRWTGPAGFTAPVYDVDLRVGGKYLLCMRSPDGKKYWSTGVYLEIDAPRKLVMTDSFADENGNVVPASHYGLEAEYPLELQVTVTLEEHDGRTEMILRHAGMPMGAEREGAREGWSTSFDKLAAVVEGDRGATRMSQPSDHQVVMSRDFDTSCETVFKAYTDPRLIPQWWGPRRTTTTVFRMDVRPGGAWRFVQEGADGSKHAFNGAYRDIVPPERLSYTFEYERMPGHVLVETMSCQDLGERARVTAIDDFASKQDRDGMLASGMEEGARESWDRFAEVLAKEAPAG
jgi:uncharacterized protein YndB with AHSA1/START domain